MVIVVVLLGAIVFKTTPLNLGGTDATDSYYDTTNTSTTVPTTATTTSPILSLDTQRINAEVCFLTGTSTIFLHQKAQATTTGVVVDSGIPLYPSSTAAGQICQDFPGFKGYLYGISAGAGTVTVSSWK